MNSYNLVSNSVFLQPDRVCQPDSWVGHIPFGMWIVEQATPRILVELGTHVGNSYFSFCQSVQVNGLETRCYAVDTWQGDEHAGYYGNDIFESVNLYNDQHYAGFSRLLRQTFDRATSHFDDGSIDLLHIDGMHSYDAVRHDFETWLPKLSERGVVLFHDTNVRERGFGVWRLWEELAVKYPHIRFDHAHGLGVLFVGKEQPEALRKLVEEWSHHEGKIRIRNFFVNLGRSVGLELHNSNLRYVVDERDKEIASLVHVLDEVKERNEYLEQNLQDTQQGLQDTQQDLQDTQQALFATRTSFSWLITAPLRFLNYLLHGNFSMAANAVRFVLRTIASFFPRAVQKILGRPFLKKIGRNLHDSGTKFQALAAIVGERCRLTHNQLLVDPLTAGLPKDLPEIDISVVTYNSERWITRFVESLLKIDYPSDLLNIYFVDNGSSDSTVVELKKVLLQIKAAGGHATLTEQPNLGFGGGHNRGVKAGKAPFCLVTNIDLVFDRQALCRVISTAVADDHSVAAWELRQKPYEHPKFYDPVTGITNWNSHTCVLLRRTAFESVGGYDEFLFMYGEDVELSYRFRRAGFVLKYCPSAIVEHYTYESPEQVKPLQYSGSTFANLYLRLKYGKWLDVLMIPPMSLRLLVSPEAFPGSRYTTMKNIARLALRAPRVLFDRRSSKAFFPFNGWEFDIVRDGAFAELKPLPVEMPLVSVITRTHRGRGLFLKQAMLSVAHQSYPNIEHIIVEDGGETQRPVVEQVRSVTKRDIKFLPKTKVGRSAAGNAGLAAANGRWCLFLDDDDLLFCEHIEVLVQALLANRDAAAAYSLAWEIVTDTSEIDAGRYKENICGVPPLLRQDFDYSILQHHNIMTIQSVLFEKSLFDERGGFTEDLDVLEDWNLWLRYAYNNRFVYIPKLTSMFRTPSDLGKIIQRDEAIHAAYITVLARAKEQISLIARSRQDMEGCRIFTKGPL